RRSCREDDAGRDRHLQRRPKPRGSPVRHEVATDDARGPFRGSSVPHVLADLAERLLLQLTNSLARQVVLVADLFERELVFVVEADTPANDARLDGREMTEQTTHLFAPLLRNEALVGRHHVVVLQEVDELAAVLVAHGAIERERRLRPRALHLVELLL